MTRYTSKQPCPYCRVEDVVTVNKSIMKRDRMSIGYRCSSCKKGWTEKR